MNSISFSTHLCLGNSQPTFRFWNWIVVLNLAHSQCGGGVQVTIFLLKPHLLIATRSLEPGYEYQFPDQETYLVMLVSSQEVRRGDYYPVSRFYELLSYQISDVMIHLMLRNSFILNYWWCFHIHFCPVNMGFCQVFLFFFLGGGTSYSPAAPPTPTHTFFECQYWIQTLFQSLPFIPSHNSPFCCCFGSVCLS